MATATKIKSHVKGLTRRVLGLIGSVYFIYTTIKIYSKNNYRNTKYSLVGVEILFILSKSKNYNLLPRLLVLHFSNNLSSTAFFLFS